MEVPSSKLYKRPENLLSFDKLTLTGNQGKIKGILYIKTNKQRYSIVVVLQDYLLVLCCKGPKIIEIIIFNIVNS